MAVAEALETDDSVELCYVGSPDGVERELAARHGLEFHGVPSGPLHGVNPIRAVGSLFRIVKGVGVALRFIREYRPDAMMLTGGWATFPAAVACRLRKVPILVFLPDIEPGSAIRSLSRMAARVAVAIPESVDKFKPGLAVHTGYPVRTEVAGAVGKREEAVRHFGLARNLPTVLVFGGSHGAQSINLALTEILEELVSYCQVLHISGRLDWPWVSDLAETLPDDLRMRYHPHPYLHDDMGLALAAASLVVSRAGAGTLGEFPLFGVPAVLVPYPHAWRYQRVNAGYMVEHGAAVRLDDGALESKLLPVVRLMLDDKKARQEMGEYSRALAVPDAAERVADELMNLARESRGHA